MTHHFELSAKGLSSPASFLVVDGLVVGLRCLAGKIVVVRIISMWDI